MKKKFFFTTNIALNVQNVRKLRWRRQLELNALQNVLMLFGHNAPDLEPGPNFLANFTKFQKILTQGIPRHFRPQMHKKSKISESTRKMHYTIQFLSLICVE